MGPPAQIVQSTGLVVLLYGDHNAFRVVPTDGRKHRTDVEPSYLGRLDWLVGGRHAGGRGQSVHRGHVARQRWILPLYRDASDRALPAHRRHTAVLGARFTTPRFWPNRGTCPPRTLRLSTDPADALVEAPPCIERDSPHMLTNEHH